MKPKIILASASRRRSRILKECDIPHTIIISTINEDSSRYKNPSCCACFNASQKAKDIAQKCTAGYIIGADTVVALRKHIIGKPQSLKEARALLKRFSAKTLMVYTGLCVINSKNKKAVTATVATKVHVKRLTTKMITTILARIDPLDRAGGFSIEGVGAYMFDNIEGSFYNVL